MAKLQFPFVRKEGKYFSPIVSTEPKYVVQNGSVVEDGEKIIGGIKGVYAKVRLSVDTPNQSELFAINTEFFPSSQ